MPARKPQWEICPVNGQVHRIEVPGGWLYQASGGMAFVPTPPEGNRSRNWQIDDLANLVAFNALAFQYQCAGKVTGPSLKGLFEAVDAWREERDALIEEGA